MEEKIYKHIAEIRGRIIQGLMYKAQISVDYHCEQLDEVYKTVTFISDKKKWDYCGIASEKDLIKLELLESLIKKEE